MYVCLWLDTEAEDPESKQFLSDLYRSVLTVMKLAETFDTDNDGVIENTGINVFYVGILCCCDLCNPHFSISY